MAARKIAYIGGGATRGPGTMASFIHQGANFGGSEFVIIDIDASRLPLIEKLARKMAAEAGVDYRISTTTDLEAGLTDCSAVLTSYRPGNFAARRLDERIPLKYDIIGQETQGPGGFFMALRSIHAMKKITKAMQKRCAKDAILFNYTNPVNIVSQAVSMYTDVPVFSFCEGPIVFAPWFAWWAGLDPAKLDHTVIGLNHQGWSVRHLYDGQDFMPLLQEAYDRKRKDPNVKPSDLRLPYLALMMGSLPAHYYMYYYFKEEILAELKASPTTRAEDIMSWEPGYWQHYREQAETAGKSELDPKRSRGGIHELELAIDAMDAVFNDRNEVLPVNIPNNGTIPDFEDKLVVEVPALVNHKGFSPLVQPHMPRQTLGLLHQLAEYQMLTARAAWEGKRIDGIRALASNPLVPTLAKAEALYDDMAKAHRKHLPARLLKA